MRSQYSNTKMCENAERGEEGRGFESHLSEGTRTTNRGAAACSSGCSKDDSGSIAAAQTHQRQNKQPTPNNSAEQEKPETPKEGNATKELTPRGKPWREGVSTGCACNRCHATHTRSLYDESNGRVWTRVVADKNRGRDAWQGGGGVCFLVGNTDHRYCKHISDRIRRVCPVQYRARSECGHDDDHSILIHSHSTHSILHSIPPHSIPSTHPLPSLPIPSRASSKPLASRRDECVQDTSGAWTCSTTWWQSPGENGTGVHVTQLRLY